MHAQEPVTITGAREPKAVRSQTAAALFAQRGTGPELRSGTRAFVFVAGKYNLQLTSPQDERLPDGRIRLADRPKKVIASPVALGNKWKGIAVFHPEKKLDQDVIDLILEHPSYGVDFVDYADVLEEMRSARVSEATSTLIGDKEALRDPAARAALRAALDAAEGEDFANPSDSDQ